VPDDTPPSYAESRLDSCGQRTATEITDLNQSKSLHSLCKQISAFTITFIVTVFILSDPSFGEQGMNAWLEFSSTSVEVYLLQM
jgi:hypothetical protein